MAESITYTLKEKAKIIYDQLMNKKINWFEVELIYFKDMNCQLNVDYNNLIIREINKHFKPNEYKLSEYFGLIFI